MMNKIFMAALAGAIVPMTAMAESNVTLYGVLDTNISAIDHVAGANGKSATQVAMGSGGEWGSRWGIRGTEDLGGGYSALFVLESGINTNNGTSTDTTRAFSRLSYIGISTPGAGVITLGRQYTAQFDTIAQFWPQTRAPQFEPYSVGMSVYVDNAAKYTLLTGPFKIIATAGMGNVAGNFRANAAYSAGITYTYGPFAIAASADQTNTAASTTAPVGSVGKVWKLDLAAKYKLGNATLFAGYKWGRTESFAQVVTQRDALYWGGVEYRFSPAFVAAAGYYFQDLRAVGTTNLPNPQQVTVRGSYFLSKRTDIYAAVTHAWNSAINLASTSTLASGETGQSGVSIGIRHVF